MPPRARKTTAKKTVARKTTARRVAAPETAVEAALKVYKARVADQVKQYKERGDLCDEEYRNIRTDLDLEEHLPNQIEHARVMFEYRGKFVVSGGDTVDPDNLGNDLAIAVADLLEKGIEISYRGAKYTVKLEDADVYDYSVEER